MTLTIDQILVKVPLRQNILSTGIDDPLKDFRRCVFVLFVGQRKGRFEFTFVQRTNFRLSTGLLFAEVVARNALENALERKSIADETTYDDREAASFVFVVQFLQRVQLRRVTTLTGRVDQKENFAT